MNTPIRTFDKRSFLLAVAVSALAAVAPTYAATITWVSDPVRPNETVLVFGGGFGNGAVGEIARLEDARPGSPSIGVVPNVKQWTPVRPLQVSDHSVKFVVPQAWKQGAYACRVRTGGGTSNVAVANAPDPWWLEGDRGETASPGGWLRIFGKCLSFGVKVTVALKPVSGPVVRLQPKKADDYALWVPLTATVKPGGYTVYVHNGYGGHATWRRAGQIDVVRPAPWKADVFKIKAVGADANQAIRAALDKAKTNGGGIIYFPRGWYEVKGKLVIPPHTVLKGEGMGLVNLYWPDMADPPDDVLEQLLPQHLLRRQSYRADVRGRPRNDDPRCRGRRLLRQDCQGRWHTYYPRCKSYV